MQERLPAEDEEEHALTATAAPVPGARVPPWQAWAPDAAGHSALRRWRRPHRLWVTLPAGAGALPRLVALLAAHPQHPAVLPTRGAPAFAGQLGGALVWPGLPRGLPPHLTPVAVVVRDGQLDEARVLGAVPGAGAPGLALMGAVPVEELAPRLADGAFSRVLVEASLGAALPRWTHAVRAAGAAAGVPVEAVPAAVMAPGGV